MATDQSESLLTDQTQREIPVKCGPIEGSVWTDFLGGQQGEKGVSSASIALLRVNGFPLSNLKALVANLNPASGGNLLKLVTTSPLPHTFPH